MKNQQISIQRAPGAPACRLWDERKSHEVQDGKLVPIPLAVTVSQAADLIVRDPSDWVVPIDSEAAAVAAEIEQRAEEQANAEAAAADGGN